MKKRSSSPTTRPTASPRASARATSAPTSQSFRARPEYFSVSAQVGTALHCANALQAGTVWVNNYDNFDVALPFGGYKESGWGRDKGEYALENYTNIKAVMMPVDPKN